MVSEEIESQTIALEKVKTLSHAILRKLPDSQISASVVQATSRFQALQATAKVSECHN